MEQVITQHHMDLMEDLEVEDLVMEHIQVEMEILPQQLPHKVITVPEEVDTTLGAAEEAAEWAALQLTYQLHTTKQEEPEDLESLI